MRRHKNDLWNWNFNLSDGIDMELELKKMELIPAHNLTKKGINTFLNIMTTREHKGYN